MEISEKLQGILATLPAKPGCYLMKNAEGKIIYVGKAISIKNRVRSYFHADASHDAKTRRLVREIADIEWIVVGSELEALILEISSLIIAFSVVCLGILLFLFDRCHNNLPQTRTEAPPASASRADQTYVHRGLDLANYYQPSPVRDIAVVPGAMDVGR